MPKADISPERARVVGLLTHATQSEQIMFQAGDIEGFRAGWIAGSVAVTAISRRALSPLTPAPPVRFAPATSAAHWLPSSAWCWWISPISLLSRAMAFRS